MEQSTLFTTSKWDLLQVLSHGDASPIELAKQAHTSLANISQQLRLLDLAGFVKSRRIPNRDKGKPRIVYSLTDEFAFIVVASMNFVEKKFIKLSAAQKSTLRCWFYPDVALAPYLERATLQLLIAAPRAVAFDSSSQTFFVISAPANHQRTRKCSQTHRVSRSVNSLSSSSRRTYTKKHGLHHGIFSSIQLHRQRRQVKWRWHCETPFNSQDCALRC